MCGRDLTKAGSITESWVPSRRSWAQLNASPPLVVRLLNLARLPRMLGKDYPGQNCPVASALEVIGERWTLLIIRDAFLGVRRYNDFAVRLDIPRAVLADRLRVLVANGIMRKRQDPDRPGRHLYELTAAGKELWPAVYDLICWGSKHRFRALSTYRHAECGTELGPGALCPACGVRPAPEDVLKVPRQSTRPARLDPVSVALHRPHRLLEAVQTD
jgi:DNA-binding HxlR family transcriptional regulator